MRKIKDSGIEWIGEIPEEWKITKLKNMCSFNRGYCFQSSDFGLENDIKFLSTNNFKNNIIDFIFTLYKRTKKLKRRQKNTQAFLKTLTFNNYSTTIFLIKI